MMTTGPPVAGSKKISTLELVAPLGSANGISIVTFDARSSPPRSSWISRPIAVRSVAVGGGCYSQPSVREVVHVRRAFAQRSGHGAPDLGGSAPRRARRRGIVAARALRRVRRADARRREPDDVDPRRARR